MHNIYDLLRSEKREDRQVDARREYKQAKSLIEERLMSPHSSGQKVRFKRQYLYYYLEKSMSRLKTLSKTACKARHALAGHEDVAVKEKLSQQVSENIWKK